MGANTHLTVQPESEKKRVAKKVMEECGIGGVITPGDEYPNCELFGHWDSITGNGLLKDGALPEGWGVVHIEHQSGTDPTTWIGVGPV